MPKQVSSIILTEIKGRRDRARRTVCVGCRFNRYNYPDELTTVEGGIPTFFCWFLFTIGRRSVTQGDCRNYQL